MFSANLQKTAGVGQSFNFGLEILEFEFLHKDQSSEIKKMNCENLQLNLPLYADDVLKGEESGQIKLHLETCPLCRAKLAEYQSLRNDLLAFAPTQMPNDLLYSVRNAVAVELNRKTQKPLRRFFSTQMREWLQYRLMPYSVGTIASLVLTFSLLLNLLSTKEATQKGVETAQRQANRSPILIASNSAPNFSEESLDYSEINLPIAEESPSINPTGALLAVTKSIVRGKMKDEDVTVVADVFGNGLARIAEVVEAPRDNRAMEDLEHALNETPNNAPFVTAKQDNRSNVVRVILKIQRVDVVEKPTRPKTKSRSL